jgi:hypothetical protein
MQARSIAGNWVLMAPAVIALAMAACAKKSENVAASYVSPLAFQQFSCNQLAEEGERVSLRAAELSGVQDRKRTGDIVATTAAIVVFWPAAFPRKGRRRPDRRTRQAER